jgi:hypothetical protein
MAGTADIALYDDQTADTGVMTTVNLVNHYSVVNAEVDDYDLNWSPETQPHEIIGHPYANLFNLYWRAYLNELYSPLARIMTCYMRLDLTDIVNFRFSDTIFIRDAYWRILEINAYEVGGDNTTQVKLIKILSTTSDCALTPSSVSIGGQVTFIDQAGDPSDGTQICCERYGYDWNPVLEICSAPGFNRDRNNGAIVGTEGIGLAQRSSVAPFMMALASGLRTSPENIYSFIAGKNLQIDAGNPHMIVGADVALVDGVQRGAMGIFGKNVYTNLPGFHLGGGWFEDTRETPLGQQQIGTVVFSGYGDFKTTSTAIELTVEGIAGKRINLPTKTGMACILTVTIFQVTAGTIAQSSVSMHGFTIRKELVTGVPTATVDTIHDIFKQTTFITPNLTIDTTTNIAEHRIKITGGGSGHPHDNCYLIGRLEYTQFKHE